MTGSSDPSSNPRDQLTETAEAGLALHLDEIASKDGVQRALHVWGKLEKAFPLLAYQPRSGVERLKLTGERVCWWFAYKWIVTYGPRQLEELSSVLISTTAPATGPKGLQYGTTFEPKIPAADAA